MKKAMNMSTCQLFISKNICHVTLIVSNVINTRPDITKGFVERRGTVNSRQVGGCVDAWMGA